MFQSITIKKYDIYYALAMLGLVSNGYLDKGSDIKKLAKRAHEIATAMAELDSQENND